MVEAPSNIAASVPAPNRTGAEPLRDAAQHGTAASVDARRVPHGPVGRWRKDCGHRSAHWLPPQGLGEAVRGGAVPPGNHAVRPAGLHRQL